MKRARLILALALLCTASVLATVNYTWKTYDINHRASWYVTTEHGAIEPGPSTAGTFHGCVGTSTNPAQTVYGTDYVGGYITVTGNATLTPANGTTIFLALSAGNSTVNISMNPGQVVFVQDTGTAGATNTTTLELSSGNINGSATKTIATAYAGLTVTCNGTNAFAH